MSSEPFIIADDCRTCRTCEKANNATENSYTCVACNCNMHLIPECAAYSPTAITGTKEHGMNAMLICKDSNEQNEKE